MSGLPLGAPLALGACLLLAACGGEPEAGDHFARCDRAALPASAREAPGAARAVTLEPAGTWHVRETPRRFVAYQSIEAEIAIAVGRGDGLVAMFDRDHLATLGRLFYRQLPGIAVDLAGVVELPFAEQMDQELFYGLEADALLIDPRLPAAFWGWSAGDIGRVAERVAPFFGNFIRYPRDESWGPPYRSYTIDEYGATLAELLGRGDRYRRLAAFREGTVERVRSLLPPPDERPAICLLNIGSDPAAGRFYLVDVAAGGARVRHYRDLGLAQAWDAAELVTGEYGACDYETLAAIDPPVIVVQWALTKCDGPDDFHERFVAPMRAHPVGRRLRAVAGDRVLPGGTGEQGPLTHLFQLEMAAQQLFPERFGAWRWGDAPGRPVFDRAALAALVRGEEAR